MIIEYLLSKKEQRINPPKRSRNIGEDLSNPSDMLRSYNVRIKRAIPHDKYVEIFLFDDVAKIDFRSILVGFRYKIDRSENKVLVGYKEA
jgi:hypothetical protein